MGYDVFLFAKTRDEKKEYRISSCQDKQQAHLSREFALFQSRDFENCELSQVEKVLDIDLSVFWKYPSNFEPDTEELEYELYMAEKEGNAAAIAAIRRSIEQVKENWDSTYDTVHKGWTRTTELRQVVTVFLEKIQAQPTFGENLEVMWGYHWGNYLSDNPKLSDNDRRLSDDLRHILATLDCMEAEGIEYVGFVGM